MAKQWRNKSGTLQLKGFEEFYEKLLAAGKSADTEAQKLFDDSARNLNDELAKKAADAGLSNRLIGQITEDKIAMPQKNLWYYSAGWKKPRPSKPLPDTYKVMFYNYGTPSGRHTKDGGQRVNIGGKWVTLGTNRGIEKPHGFIKKAKLAAARKNKKLCEETLEKILGDLK